MNCIGLQEDINSLRQELAVLEAGIEEANETGRCSRKFREVVKSGLGNEVLEKYLDDFVEKNPEFFNFDLGERIDIKDIEGKPASIFSITQISDERVLIGGGNGTLYDGSYDSQGEFVLGERIDIKDADGEPASIFSIAQVTDRYVLIGGENGMLYVGSYGAEGELELGELTRVTNLQGEPVNVYSIASMGDGYVLVGGEDDVLGVGRCNGEGKLEFSAWDADTWNDYNTAIYSIASMEDGHVLIGEDSGRLYFGSFNEHGELDLISRILIEDAYGNAGVRREMIGGFSYLIGGEGIVECVTQIGDRRILIGGGRGIFYSGSYDDVGVDLDERIDIKDIDGEPASIKSIVKIGDGCVLIGGSDGTLYIGSYDDKGEFSLGERIDTERDSKGNYANTNVIVKTNDRQVLIGGYNGVFYSGSLGGPRSIGGLKKYLPDIAKKKH